ncbi:MAG: 3-deoxy-manno-octulosonate cytidylyltransferase [Gemmatimonadota bacterium]
MPTLGVIPARLGSTRLPRKPLQLLAGRPLVLCVMDRVAAFGLFDRLVVATEAPEIAELVEAAGGEALLTSAAHETGTERVAEVARTQAGSGYDVVVNVQGDEPFISRQVVAGAIARVEAGDDVGTAAVPLTGDPADPARVKVVLDARGRALYFSRAPIPYRRDQSDGESVEHWQHVGVYACRRDALLRWVTFCPPPAERAERLEQLRALHHGLTIGVALLDEPAGLAIDTPADLARANELWDAFQKGSR